MSHSVAWHLAQTGTHGDKYTSTNPLARRMVAGFMRDVTDLVRLSGAISLIDAGCGEGEALARLSTVQGLRLAGCEWGSREVRAAAARVSEARLSQASVYALPFRDTSADLVSAMEVLEHLEDPEAALAEFERVSRRWVLITVPREPVWRLLNFARGQYRDDWGNSPGHIRHWSRPAIERLVGSRFRVRAVRTPFPWTAVLAEKG
jgi:ubiquinone/menaquinone biosynthesis C-methylase UbiE